MGYRHIIGHEQLRTLFVIAAVLVLSGASFSLIQKARAATNLVAAYSFNETSGTTVIDASGVNNNGTITNATRTVNGKNGGALSFDGNGDWVTVNDSPSLDLTNRMTIEAWVRPAAQQSWSTVIMKERGTNGLSYTLYGGNNSNRPALFAYIGAERSAVGSTALPLNTWSHVAGTYDGANLKLYVNGQLVRTTARTGNITTSNNPLRIGGNSVWGEYFNGSIDDVRIYGAALTQAEIQTDMNTPVAPPAPDTTSPSAPTNVSATAVSSTQVNLSWTASTDNVGVTGYRVLRNAIPAGSPTGTTFSDTTVTAGNTYSYVIRAVDAAGNLSPESSTATVTTPTPDVTQPTVSITNPVDGASVSGSVSIAADAADNVAVAGVRFYANGTAIGVEDTTAPYAVSWDTASLTAGTYSLTAIARDTASNTTTSSAVNVTISGDFSFTVPQSSITLPSNGEGFYEIDVAYLSGFTSTGLDLWAQDLPAGMSGEFLFDPMVHQGTTEYIVTTEGISDGTYTFTLGATDLGGSNISHSKQVTLVIDNTPDFAISATPQIQNVTTGGSVDFSVSTAVTNNFTSPVSFTTSTLPTGLTALFTPSSITPPGTANMRLSTTANATPGQYTITVNATGNGITRSTQVVVNVTANNATWNVSILGSTGTPNNTVRVGKIRTDNMNRLYVGTIGTGRVLEYNWNGSSWGNPVDVGGSPTNQEIHDMTIGDGRGDGQNRIYAASYDNKVYEIWHDGTAWRQVAVATLNNLGMHAAVGDGRGDGVQRLYLVSTSTLYEYTWNGTAWVGGVIGNTPGAHGAIVAAARGGGQMGVYVASISSGSFEARWNGSSWSVTSMGDSGDVRGIYAGNARGDGITRVYGALLDGRIREYSWNGSSWMILNSPSAPGGLIHSYILPGRNDGINRIYASSTDGKVYELTWNGSSWSTPLAMGGGTDYMYGQHFGDARNDGITRIYSADRGSVNRVYEYTWSASAVDTQPPTAPLNLSATGGTGTASLSWTAATDNVGVARYNIYRATTPGFVPSTGNKVGETTTQLSFSQNGLSPGTYYYVVTAQDGAGNISQASNEASAVVTGDAENPTVSLTAPSNGTTVSGSVTLAATASDNAGLAGVTFLVDDVVIASEDTTAPYSVTWNTLTASNGTHTITARARDNANNTAVSAAVTVTVNNTVISNLIASYSFNEGAGSTVNDGAGGDNNGTITSALWSTAGKYGNALSFDGNGDWVTINDANNLDLTTGMTLEAWVRPNALSGWTTAILKESTGTLSYSLYASDNTGQPPAGYVRIGGTDQSVRGTGLLALNTWTHLTTTYDGSTMRMYVNGTQVASRSVTGTIATSNGALRIGGNSVWGEYFNGLIDEVRVYNRALSATEIQADMNAAL